MRLNPLEVTADQSPKREKKQEPKKQKPKRASKTHRISDFTNKNKSGEDRSTKLCDKTGHWIQHCPKLDEARDSLKGDQTLKEDALIADEDSEGEENFEAAFIGHHNVQVGV